VSGVHHSAICTADVERSLRFWRDGLGLGNPQTPDSGIVELVEFADADEALSALAESGFTDGVRRIAVPAPDGKTVAMAVVTAPDGVLVELIGVAQ